jgi:uncharacterized protein (TIGR02453 family)
MSPPSPRFSQDTLKFLRALKRNNNREWFGTHKDDYEARVRVPMLAVIERLAEDFPQIAPDLIASPRSMYRVYRDTRFSPDKTPYKTHIAASFSHKELPKHESAGLYFHLAPDQLWIGGGVYAPQSPQLQRIREHLVANFGRFRSLVESPAFRRLGGVTGAKLKRVPRGFPQDHEAADYLKLKQFLVGEELNPQLATSPRFYGALVRRFTTLAPFIQFINTPLAAAAPFKL